MRQSTAAVPVVPVMAAEAVTRTLDIRLGTELAVLSDVIHID